MSWVKLFVPSWSFFDRQSETPILYFRYQMEDDFTNWSALNGISDRSFLKLFLNPLVNHRLALQSLVFRLVNETNELRVNDIENSKSFQLIKSLVKEHLSEPKPKAFQFKISTQEDLIVSQIYEL